MKFWCRVFRTRYEIVVAICDKELLGKKLDFNGVKIEIKKKFYGERLISEREAINLLENATIGNLMGKKIVELAINYNFISPKNIIWIEDVPHAQFAKL